MPMKATTSSGQKSLKAAKPRPVRAISRHAANSSGRVARRAPVSPTARVSSADLSSVAVANAPTCRAS